MTHQQSYAEDDSNRGLLTVSIRHILFTVNSLLTCLGTILIFRYRKVALNVFEEFEIPIPAVTEIVLSRPTLFLLPVLLLGAALVQFKVQDHRKVVICHIVHSGLIIMMITGFVATVLPTMLQLLETLQR